MACLDTSLLIDLGGRAGSGLRRRAESKIAQLIELGEELTTTRINVAELLVGVYRADDRKREQRNIDAVLEPVSVLDFDEEAAQVFAEATATLLDRGRPVGDMDVLIAAIAIVNGEKLITRDVSHFSAIPGLVVESY